MTETTDKETTRQTLDIAAVMLEETALHLDSIHSYVRNSLRMFIVDPADSDFQRGYCEALKIFAHECLGFKRDDELLWGATGPAPEPTRKPALTVIHGDKP